MVYSQQEMGTQEPFFKIHKGNVGASCKESKHLHSFSDS